MAEVNYLLGMNAKMYWGESGSTPPNLSAMEEADNVMDVTVNGQTEEADITSRANAGWAATAATLRKLSISFKALWKPGDEFFDAIQTAWLGNGTIHIAALDQDAETTGASGPKGDFTVTNFTKSEPLKEGQTVDVTLSLAAWDTYVKVTGS